MRTILKWMVDGDGSQVVYHDTTGFDWGVIDAYDSNDSDDM
jgi:hypothetical protein